MPDDHVDFLGLAERSFSGVRLVVFGGMSGSGKSTAIEFLLRRHPDFAGQDWVTVARDRHGLRFPRCRGRTVAVDEVISPTELWGVARLVRHNRVLVATHLPLACFAGLAVWCRTRVFHTDRDAGKVAVMLERRGITVPADTLREYQRTFGANFLDAHLILERWPSDRFDRSYAAFVRWCRVHRTPWGGRLTAYVPDRRPGPRSPPRPLPPATQPPASLYFHIPSSPAGDQDTSQS